MFRYTTKRGYATKIMVPCGSSTGFTPNPAAIRAEALAAAWWTHGEAGQGGHYLERASDTKERLFQIAPLVSKRRPNWEELDASYEFWKKASCGGFAAMFEGRTRRYSCASTLGGLGRRRVSKPAEGLRR